MDIQDIRRAQLRKWIAVNGTPSKEKSYFSQLGGGSSSFGERAARRLERDYRMGAGYLDDINANPSMTSLPATKPGSEHISPKSGEPSIDPQGDLIKQLLPPDKGNVIVWERPEDLEPDENRVWIDRYDYHFSAGTGLIQWEVREKKALPFDVGFFKALGSKPKDCKLLTVRGDSMEPFLFNRDMMMVDAARTNVRDGQVYAIYFEDEPLVKQIFKQVGGGIVLHSYNAKYPDRAVPAESMDLIKIVGEVIYRSGSAMAGGN